MSPRPSAFSSQASGGVWLSEVSQRRKDATGRMAGPGASPGGPHPPVRPDYGWLQAAALGLVVAAFAHLAVMPDHLHESWMYGTFFLCIAIAQTVLASLILARPTRNTLAAGVAGSFAVVALWAASRFIGVPIGPDNGGTETIGVLDVLATIAELLTAVSCSILLWRGRARPAWRWSLWSAQLRLMLLTTSIGVPLAAIFSSRG